MLPLGESSLLLSVVICLYASLTMNWPFDGAPTFHPVVTVRGRGWHRRRADRRRMGVKDNEVNMTQFGISQ